MKALGLALLFVAGCAHETVLRIAIPIEVLPPVEERSDYGRCILLSADGKSAIITAEPCIST